MPLSNPPTGRPSPFVLTTMGEESLGDMMASNRRRVVSSAWLTANLAFFYPFKLMEPRTFVGIQWANGATVSGNVNGAIYNTDGSVVSGSTIGSAAQATISVPQKKAFTAPVTLPTGYYFLAFTCDNTTATFMMSGTSSGFLRFAGVRQLASFFALTASASAWVGMASNIHVLVALYESSWL